MPATVRLATDEGASAPKKATGKAAGPLPLRVLAGSNSWKSDLEAVIYAEANMGKLKFLAVILIAPTTGIAAHAQDNGDKVAPEISGPTRQDYVTSTGATVPRPETLPRSSGETALDRKMRQRSKQIMNSICSGC